MAHYTGTVSRIIERTFGNKVKFSFFLEGVDGTLFKMNETRPTFKEGGRVEFDASDKGFVSNLKSLAPEQPTPQTTTIQSTNIENRGGPSPYIHVPKRWHRYEDRQYAEAERRSIVRQKALDLALTAVNAMLDREAIKLPAKQSEKMESYLEFVTMATDVFYADLAVDHSVSGAETGTEDKPSVSDSVQPSLPVDQE